MLLARTVSAIREITVQEGLDPREFSMLAYGGAGPMFVPLVAREMDVREVIVPQAPAGFSAWGMLMTDLVQEYSETCVGLLEHVGLDNLHGITHGWRARPMMTSIAAASRRPTGRSNTPRRCAISGRNTRSIRRWRRATISTACAGVSTSCTSSVMAIP